MVIDFNAAKARLRPTDDKPIFDKGAISERELLEREADRAAQDDALGIAIVQMERLAERIIKAADRDDGA
jgi:hypothetical protein